MGVVANGVLFVLFDERPVAYSPDGKRICTSSGFGAVSMWDAVSGRPLFTLRRQVGCTHLAFSPDGHRIVTVDMDGQAKVLEAATGRVLLLLKGPSAGSACFSPDGQRVVTAAGTAVTVWDAVTGREMLTIEGHSGRITSLAFSPDGQRIVTGSWDNTAKVWQTASPDQVATWQKEEQDAAQRLTTLEQERNTAEESRTAER